MITINVNSVITGASNGVYLDGNTIKLGGNLVQPTIITTDVTNNLAFAGLQTGSVADKIMVLDATTNVLKSIVGSTFATSTATTGYIPVMTTATNIGNSVMQEVLGAINVGGIIRTSESYRFNGTYTFTSGIAAIGIASSGSMLIQGSQTNTALASIIFVGQNGATLGEIYNDSSRTTELSWISTNNNIRIRNNATSIYQTTIEQNNTGLFVGHDSSIRTLALQTDNTSRIIISGSGIINLPSIPTSPAGLSSGDIWSNSGVLTIV
jgi:hypothetical protein